MLFERFKHTREGQRVRALVPHSAVYVVFRWMRRPFVWHLILLLLSALTAISLGWFLLRSQHPATAQGLHPVTPLGGQGTLVVVGRLVPGGASEADHVYARPER